MRSGIALRKIGSVLQWATRAGSEESRIEGNGKRRPKTDVRSGIRCRGGWCESTVTAGSVNAGSESKCLAPSILLSISRTFKPSGKRCGPDWNLSLRKSIWPQEGQGTVEVAVYLKSRGESLNVGASPVLRTRYLAPLYDLGTLLSTPGESVSVFRPSTIADQD